MPEPSRSVDYYFSFISLYSYIGSATLRDLTARRGLTLVHKPVDLMAVFAASGGQPVKQRAAQRQAYRLVEMQRWAAVRQIPLVLHPKFYPADPARGHRMLLEALRRGQDVAAFSDAALKAVWADEQNVADAETLVRLADAGGLDGKALLAASEDPSLQRAADELTREAIARNVFGAPFFFYRDEPFWGQDRLDMLEAAITTQRAPILIG